MEEPKTTESGITIPDGYDERAYSHQQTVEVHRAYNRLRRNVEDGSCTHAEPGRGDCEHAIGLPGLIQVVDHDGPNTEDAYGKPNGWCWSCWLSHQLAQAQEKLWKQEAALEVLVKIAGDRG